MLSPTERELVQRDPALPGLERLLDAAAFRDALQTAAGLSILSARLRYLRYKPAQNCLAAFTLNLGGIEVECHAKAYRLVDATKLDKVRRRPCYDGPLGGGRFVWPHLGIEACVFPNDNKLDSLPLLADPVRREDFLRRHLPGRADLWRSTVRTLAYKPERRWVGALEVDGVPRAVCKLYGKSAFDDVRAKARHFASGKGLNVPLLLGRSKGRQALFFGWERGEVLSQLLLKSDFAAAALEQVGGALHELQQQEMPGLPARSPEIVTRTLRELGEFIAFLLPEVGARVRKLAAELATAIRTLPPDNATIHGDFYAKQVLLEGNRVTVLDLDEAACGDALTDLGSFIAHLEREVIAGRLSAGQSQACRDQLLAGYCRSGGRVDEGRLELHTAERLFARAADFFRTLHDDWGQHTEALISRVEGLLAAAPHGTSSRRTHDPKLPMLERALSPLVVAPDLTKLLSRPDGRVTDVRLEHVKLRRHKPGRRALIEYELTLQRAGRAETVVLLGKLRRRGVDAELLALWRDLSASSFAADHPDGIAMPDVVGVIAELGITLQRRVAGQSLGELLPGPRGLQAARRAAEAIAKLHHSGVLPRKTHTIADELEILDGRLSGVAESKAVWAVRLADLRNACHQLARRLPNVSPRPIHRDFYHDQLLLEANRVWLLDLDLLCAGDPALDAGNFVGHLHEWAIRSPADAPALRAAAAVFTDRYLELNGNCPAETVEIYATLTLARHVSISTQLADRAPFTEDILRMCEERCAHATNQSCRQLAATSNV